jgi:capsular exopolysaccharide synthesis family protein
MQQLTLKNAIIMLDNPTSPISECYRSLRINLDFFSVDREIRTIAITSAHRGEGKTTTALNLSVAYAHGGKKVLLIDADLRVPAVGRAFPVMNGKGLTDLLTGRSRLTDVVRETDIDCLSVIMAGSTPPNPSELLASHKMNAILEELSQIYEVIIIDTPPALGLIDAKIMAAKCDGVLLVLECGKVKRSIARKVKEDLVASKANLLGVVLNKNTVPMTEGYYA